MPSVQLAARGSRALGVLGRQRHALPLDGDRNPRRAGSGNRFMPGLPMK